MAGRSGRIGNGNCDRWIDYLAFNRCDSHQKLAHAEEIEKNGKTDE